MAVTARFAGAFLALGFVLGAAQPGLAAPYECPKVWHSSSLL